MGAQTDLAEQQKGKQDPCHEHDHRTRMHLVVPSLFLLLLFCWFFGFFSALLLDLGQYFYLCFPFYLLVCLFVLFFFFLNSKKMGK